MGVLIPSGLHRIHPQLEPAFKSIQNEFRATQGAISKSGASGNTAQILSRLASIQQQIDELKAAAPSGEIYRAAAPLPPFMAVYESYAGSVNIADISSDATSNAVVGITTAGTSTGSMASIAGNFDNVKNPAWSWTPGLPIFLSTNGTMTQTASNVMMGYAISATQMLVVIAESQPGVPASLYEVEGTVTIPANYNLLIAGDMHVSGDIILHGDAVGVLT